jgi:hypothetical protein
MVMGGVSCKGGGKGGGSEISTLTIITQLKMESVCIPYKGIHDIHKKVIASPSRLPLPNTNNTNIT